MSVVGRSKLDNPPLNTPGGTALYAQMETLYGVLSNNAAGRYYLFSGVANNTLIQVDHNFGVPFSSLVVEIFTGTFPNFVAVTDPTINAPTWTIAADPSFPTTIVNVTTPISGSPWTGMIWITQTALSDRQTTAKLLTGYSAAPGTVSATDSILTAINKIVGNIGNIGASSWVTKTSNYTAVNGDLILANTSGGVFTISLPPSPSVGNSVTVADQNRTWETNNLTIAGNGSNIFGSPTSLVCDISGSKLQLVYVGGTIGWQVYT